MLIKRIYDEKLIAKHTLDDLLSRGKGAKMYQLEGRSDKRTLSDGDLKNILLLHKHDVPTKEIAGIFDLLPEEAAGAIRHVLQYGYDQKASSVADPRRPWTSGDVATARALWARKVAPEKIAHILCRGLQEVYLRID
jgi:hypothetical protein